jgi:biotin carboxyl carrier protein
MKRYQITLDGQIFDVLLLSDPRQEQVQVEVDGVAFTAQVKTLPLEQAADAAPTAQVEPAAPGVPSAPMQPPGARTAAATSNVVTAPLPGVIKSIAIQPGQRVSSGDQLLVIEAMKMDNIIRASRDGTVDTIFASEGRQVGYGERLLQYAQVGAR